MSTSRQTDAAPSRRVESWIHEVINPLLEALDVEMRFLDKGNCTWRIRGELEYVRPHMEYLGQNGLHILDEFRRKRPEVAERLRDHDESAARLERLARQAHRELTRDEEFRQAVEEARQSFGQEVRQTESLVAHAAESLVNGLTELPTHYVHAEFWAHAGKELQRFTTGKVFERLESSLTEHLENDRELVEWLGDLRFELCEAYEVPAAPYTSAE